MYGIVGVRGGGNKGHARLPRERSSRAGAEVVFLKIVQIVKRNGIVKPKRLLRNQIRRCWFERGDGFDPARIVGRRGIRSSAPPTYCCPLGKGVLNPPQYCRSIRIKDFRLVLSTVSPG